MEVARKNAEGKTVSESFVAADAAPSRTAAESKAPKPKQSKIVQIRRPAELVQQSSSESLDAPEEQAQKRKMNVLSLLTSNTGDNAAGESKPIVVTGEAKQSDASQAMPTQTVRFDHPGFPSFSGICTVSDPRTNVLLNKDICIVGRMAIARCNEYVEQVLFLLSNVCVMS